MYASRCQILFGNVLLPTIGADHYHKFTVAADIRILVLRTFPGNTLWRTAVDIHFINLRTTGLVRSKCQVLAIREPGRFGIVTATISHLADLTRSQIHYVQVQTTGFRQGECQFAADPDYVDTYNAANNTAYQLLPEGSYSFESVLTLPSSSNSTNLTVTIDGSGLTPGDYLLPVRLTEASMFSVSANSAVYPLVVRVIGTQLDRSGWSISANTQEPTGEGVGNGVATCLLDGDLSTFWHSQWSGGSQPLPHEIVVDMNRTVTLTNIGLIQRQHDSYRDVGGGEFFVSIGRNLQRVAGTRRASIHDYPDRLPVLYGLDYPKQSGCQLVIGGTVWVWCGIIIERQTT